MRPRSIAPLASVAAAVAMLSACGGDDSSTDAQNPPDTSAVAYRCDDSLKSAFQPDALTKVLSVKPFKAGSPVALAAPAGDAPPPIAPHDLCMVKLVVGPGNPGPEDAPSTTSGIGIEVWIPQREVWDKRIQLIGQGGSGGMPDVKNPAVIAASAAMELAISDRTVSAMTDHAHTDAMSQAFFMDADGGINRQGWEDASHRAIHEMAVKVKSLAKGFYGQAQDYAYLMGCSGAGRDGYASAQTHPEDFDGIFIGAPAINWTQFIGGYENYPRAVVEQDLGGVHLTAAQRELVSAAAVSACDSRLNGEHDGYITDPSQCRYDPTRDASVLCVGSGGSNAGSSCLSTVQATAVNKMWYGQTVDGSVPDPQVDNGQSPSLAPKQLWFGIPHGTDLASLSAAPAEPPFFGPFPIAANTLPLILQDPKYGIGSGPAQFRNPTGNGQDLWKSLGYADLANVFHRGVALQSAFANMNANNPDLTAFQRKGGKILTWHGTNDVVIPFGGTVHYYERSAAVTGGFAQTQAFHRFFPVPGVAHCTGFAADGRSGTSPAAASKVPYFKNPPELLRAGPREWFGVLRDWVEHGKAPDAIVMTSADGTNSRPVCPYPQKLAYLGGDRNAATSYSCR